VKTITTIVAAKDIKTEAQARLEFWERMATANGGRAGNPEDYINIVSITQDQRGFVIRYEVPAEFLEQRAVSVIREDPEPLEIPLNVKPSEPVYIEPPEGRVAHADKLMRSVDALVAKHKERKLSKCHVLSCIKPCVEGSSYCEQHQDKDARFKDTTQPTEIMPSLIMITGFNPRKAFDPAQLEELKASIREHGIIEPLLVRPKGTSRYELVVGERRLRAARELGLEHVPVVVRQLTDEQVLDIMLAENLQRVDLNPIEEAHHLKRVLEMNKGLTQTDLGRRIGKSQEWVANRLRLATMPSELQDEIIRARITATSAIDLAGWYDTDHYNSLIGEVLRRLGRGEEMTQARVREIIKEVTEPEPVRESVSTSVYTPVYIEPELKQIIDEHPEEARAAINEASAEIMKEAMAQVPCVPPRYDGQLAQEEDADDRPDEPEPTAVAEVGPHELGKASRDPWAKDVRTFDCKVCHQVFIDKKGMETVAMVTHLIGDGYHDAHEDTAQKVLAKAHERPIKEDLLRYFGGGSELEDDVRVREHEADLAVKEFDDGSRWNGATYLEECCRNGNKEAIEARKSRNKLTEARLKIRKEAEARGVTL